MLPYFETENLHSLYKNKVELTLKFYQEKKKINLKDDINERAKKENQMIDNIKLSFREEKVLRLLKSLVEINNFRDVEIINEMYQIEPSFHLGYQSALFDVLER